VNDTERTALQGTLATLSGAATAAGTVLTGPSAVVARVIAASLGVASAMLSQGATPQQAVDAIKRVRHIDTRADDAAVDAKVDAKPSRDAGIPAKFLRELGTADTVPAPSAERGPPRCDVCGVAFSEANCVNEDCPLNDHTRRDAAWGEPGEGG